MPTADGKAEARGTTNNELSNAVVLLCTKFLNIIKLFLDTPIQDKHEDFIKKVTVNYSIIVGCSVHFPPGGRNSGSATDRVIADSRYSESRYSQSRYSESRYNEARLYMPSLYSCN